MLQYFSQHKSIEDNQYTIEDFLFRWKKLERVLSKESVDGLLLATGLDARDCVQSAYLFNWLFLGLSGKPITINKYLDTIYSQIIVIVSPIHNFIFITPQAKAQLETLIYAIPNCTVFCPTEKEYQNKELLDTLKIATFYKMIQKINKIGVFLGQNQDIKSIQKWPLIQSYALQPVGRTFFTLKHQALNIGSKILNLFKNFDRHALKNLSGRTAYSMQGHIKGSTTFIQLKNLKQRGSITQLSLQESLQEAVDIGLFESGTSEYKGLVRVLFGNRTNSNENISGKYSIDQAHAEHLTIQHYDPYTKMKVWRTYFLNLTKKTQRVVSMETQAEQDSFLNKTFYDMKQKKNVHYDDQNSLISLYSGLVQAVNQSISSVSKDYRNLNKQFLHQFILGKINQMSTHVYKSEIFKKEDLLIQIQSFDSFGQPRPIDFKDSISFKLASTFYVIKCKLLNVVSPNNNKIKLGGLIFSQNFVIQEGCYLLLTKSIPYFDFWKCGGQTDQTLLSLNPNYDFLKLGKPISNQGFKNKMFIPCQKMSNHHFNLPILDIKYYFHQNGLRIFNQKIGWHIIFYHQINDMTMINKISGQWVIMKTQNPLIFDSLQTNILMLQFRGKPFDFLINLTKRKVNPIILNFIQSIPPFLNQNWQFIQQILKKPVRDGALIHQHQILVKDFLWSFIESKQLMIINQMKDIKLVNFKNIYNKKIERKKDNVENNDKHNIVVLNGSYGSNKYKLAKNLKKFGPNNIKCNIFNIGPDNLYNRISSEAFIDMVQQYINTSDIPLEKDQVTIVIIPSWLNCTQTLPLLSQKYHIRSVLTKINSNNFYSNQNMNLVQDVLVFCLPGYSQNIVVDSYAQEQSLINSVIRVVGTYNRQIRVARCTSSLLTTGQCSDILQDTSYEGQYQTFLRQKYGAFYNFMQLAKTQLNYIEFNLPIHNFEKLKKFNKSQGYLVDRKAVLKQLEHKKRQAQNSKDDLMMGLYFLEQVMSIVRKRQKVTQIRSIKGLVKMKKSQQSEQTQLVDLCWANDQFKQEQSRSIQRPLGFSILSVRYDQMEVKKLIQTMSYKNYLFGQTEAIRTIQSLSQKQKKQIEKDAIENNKCFENGEYYDGYVLRNVEGFSIEGHPYLEKVYENWITQENQRIMKRNNEIKNSWNQYCAKNK